MSKTLIVTLNYNSIDLIGPLYASLNEKLPKEGWDWLIRDNSDSRPLADISDSRVSILPRKNEGTFASQHNDLMKEKLFDKYEYLILLNNDMIAVNDFLTPMIKILNDDDTVGAVGAQLFYPNGQLQHGGICITHDKMPFNINQYTFKKASIWPTVPQKNRIFQAVTGACLDMRVNDYKKLGGMDENFHWCFDDVDLCLRATQELGKLCVYCVDAKLIHIENYSTLKNPTNLKPNFPMAFERLKNKFQHNLRGDIQFYQGEYGEYK